LEPKCKSYKRNKKLEKENLKRKKKNLADQTEFGPAAAAHSRALQQAAAQQAAPFPFCPFFLLVSFLFL
jgi:hypothetical protein